MILGKTEQLSPNSLFSIYYHSLFEYPLGEMELIKWEAGPGCSQYVLPEFEVETKAGQYFLKGKGGLVYKKKKKERVSQRKIEAASRGVKLLTRIPTIKFIGLTGALAMANADSGSDIDLLLICQKGTLWTSRFMALVLLKLFSVPIRRFGKGNQEDKLCLNMWLDETSLAWPKVQRNVYTAHEIAQIVPVVNKDHAYERFLFQNTWIKSFWPNAVRIRRVIPPRPQKKNELKIIETLTRKLQYWYMQPKITRETVTKTKAIFHPQDWSARILEKLG